MISTRVMLKVKGGIQVLHFLKTMDLLLIEINFRLFVKNEVKLPCRLFHGCSERLGGTRTPDTGLLLSNNQYAAASCRLE